MENNTGNGSTDVERMLWRKASIGVAVLVLAIIIGAVLFGFIELFMVLRPVLLPVVLAGLLTYLLSPLVDMVATFLEGRDAPQATAPQAATEHSDADSPGKKRKKTFSANAYKTAIWIVLLGIGGLLFGIGYSVVPHAVKQGEQLIAHREQIIQKLISSNQKVLEDSRLLHKSVEVLHNTALNDALEESGHEQDLQRLQKAQHGAEKLEAVCNYYSDIFIERAIDWFSSGTRAVGRISLLVVGACMVPVFLFYFLWEKEAIRSQWHEYVIPVTHESFHKELKETLGAINDKIIFFIRGQMLVSLIDGLLLFVALKFVGLPYAFIIGIVAALLGIIPFVGMICAWIPAVLIALFTPATPADVNAADSIAAMGALNTHLAVVVTIIFIVVSQLDGWLIQPRIVGAKMKMHDLTVMFSVIFWSYVLGGVVGALLAVPLTAAIQVVFNRYVWQPRKKKREAERAAENQKYAGMRSTEWRKFFKSVYKRFTIIIRQTPGKIKELPARLRRPRHKRQVTDRGKYEKS